MKGGGEAVSYIGFAIAFLAAFGVVSLFTPRTALFLSSRGITVPDRYKRTPRTLPTMGSLPLFIFLALLLSLLTTGLVLPFQPSSLEGLGFDVSGSLLLLAALVLVTVIVYGVIGAVDDLVHLGYLEKILLPLLAGLPLALYFVSAHESAAVMNLELILSATSLGVILPGTLAIFVLVPLVLTLTANLANMHAGFNGLQTGLTGILIVFLVAKLALAGLSPALLVPLSFLGGWAAILSYNRYPARIFEGNMGSFMGGGRNWVFHPARGILHCGGNHANSSPCRLRPLYRRQASASPPSKVRQGEPRWDDSGTAPVQTEVSLAILLPSQGISGSPAPLCLYRLSWDGGAPNPDLGG